MCDLSQLGTTFLIKITAPCGKILLITEAKNIKFDSLDEREVLFRLKQLGEALGIGFDGWTMEISREVKKPNFTQKEVKFLK